MRLRILGIAGVKKVANKKALFTSLNQGRLKFGDQKNYAPFDSVVVVLNHSGKVRVKQ